MLAFSEADALYGGPTVPTTATWTRLVAQLAQVCLKMMASSLPAGEIILEFFFSIDGSFLVICAMILDM